MQDNAIPPATAHTAPADDNTPIDPQLPMPHRKVIRSWLKPWSQRNTLLALGLLVFDYALFLGLISAVVMVSSGWLKLLFGLMAGFVIGRLFIIGHDACHQSLTEHRPLNKVLGRLAFLPSLTPYSLWDVGHNVIHHGYTCLKGTDFVWEPLTAAEYEALSPVQRILQRLYRSGWAPGLYYMIEIWWKREFFPNEKHMPTRRAIFTQDSQLTLGAWVVWLLALAVASFATGQSLLSLWFFGFAVPFFTWCSMIGFVVYVHHTHEKVSWHNDKTAWSKAQPFVSTTVHLLMPLRLGALMHHIMEHTAHHVDMSIPMYQLKNAQTTLEHMLPERIVIQQFSWRWYFDTARKCKLYCFERHAWLDFKGRITAFPRKLHPVPAA